MEGGGSRGGSKVSIKEDPEGRGDHATGYDGEGKGGRNRLVNVGDAHLDSRTWNKKKEWGVKQRKGAHHQLKNWKYETVKPALGAL